MKEPGELLTFDTGAKREGKMGKGRPDLISPIMLKRLALLMEEGGFIHGDRSWELGMPLMSVLSCAFRHLIQILNGEEDEDHPIQAICNLQFYVHTLEKIQDGTLPEKLDDRPWKKAVDVEPNVIKTRQSAYCCSQYYRRHLEDDKIKGSWFTHCSACQRGLFYA